MADGQRKARADTRPVEFAPVRSLLTAAVVIGRATPGVRGLLIGLNLLALVSCAVQLSIPFLFGRSFSGLFSGEHSATWTRNIYLLLSSGALSALLTGIESRLALRLRHRSVMLLEARCCEALLGKPVFEVKARETGELASHLAADVSAAADLIGLQAALTRIGVLTLGSLLLIVWLNPLVAAAVALVALIYCLIILQVTPRVVEAYRLASNDTARASSFFYQLIGAALDIRVFGSRGFFQAAFARKAQAKAEAMIVAGRLSKRIDQSAYMVQLLGSFVILVAATRYAGGELGMSGVLAAMGVLAFFWSSLRSGITQFLNVRKNLPLIGRLRGWLAPPIARRGAKDAPTPPVTATGRPSAISFRNVTFRFPDADHEVLHDLSFDIAPGERILLTGDNGTGKTTLMFLMLGLLEPTSGTVLLDGVPCEHIDETVLRRMIVRVAHDGYLFPGSIEENIAFGREATLTPVAMAAAMGLSGCTALLAASEPGAGIGERGSRLSAGQRQRILIARALAGQAGILLLDEATASIDADSTRAIYQQLLSDPRRPGKTIMVTAHHSEFLASMVDRQLHLAGGRLREVGGADPLRLEAALVQS